MKTMFRIKPISKIISMILTILLIFYVVPGGAYVAAIEELSGENPLSSVSEDNLSSSVEDQAVSSIPSDYTIAKGVYEDTTLRDERTKHFRLEDGSYLAAVYSAPVHYKDDNGEWQDIDNRLFYSGNEISGTDGRIKFAKKISGNGNLFTLHDGNAKITMSLSGANKKTEGVALSGASDEDGKDTELFKLLKLENLKSSVIYEDILDGVDIEYIANSNSIKENIIVKQRNDDGIYSYKFELALNNLSAEITDDGSITIIDENGETEYYIPAPIVYDSNNEYAPQGAAKYELISSGNKKYELTVEVSSEWMNDSERAYPVTVDPTINDGLVSYYNVGVSSAEPDSTKYALNVGTGKHVYWKILDDSLPAIPTSAYLTKFEITLSGSGAVCVGAYEVLSNWDTSLTWNKTAAETPEGELSSNLLDYNNTGSAYNWYTWDITDAAKKWYNGDGNYGIVFKPAKEASNTFSMPTFNDYDNGSNSTVFPMISIGYVDTMGIEDYYSYSSQSAGLAGAGSINLATGALSFAISTLSTTDYIMPISPSLVYNSAICGEDYIYGIRNTGYTSSYMPKGFKLSLGETIIKRSYLDEEGVSRTQYIFADADGTEHYFYESAEGTNIYYDDSGLRMKLDASNSSLLKIEYVSGDSKSFENISGAPSGTLGRWYLSEITDTSGDSVKIVLDSSGRPSAVKLIPNGLSSIDMLSFIYNNGKLSMIRNDTTKEAAVLKYSETTDGEILATGSNYLRRVIYAHGSSSATAANWDTYYSSGSAENITTDATMNYTYSSKGWIVVAEDSLSGRTIRYEYYGGKVRRCIEVGGTTVGQTVMLGYSNGYSEICTSGADDDISTSADNIVTRYVFDELGRTKSSYSTNVGRTEIYGAVAGEYESQENVKNNIKNSTTVGGGSSTYILNGGFEDTGLKYWTYEGTVARTGDLETLGGEYRVQLISRSDAKAQISQKLSLPADNDYTMSFDYSSHAANNSSLVFGIINLADGSTLAESRTGLDECTEGATVTASLTFNLPAATSNYSVQAYIYCLNTSAEAESAFIDDVIISRGIGVSDFNYAEYGNFEASAIDSTGAAYPVTEFWNGGVFVNDDSFGRVGAVISYSLSAENEMTQVVYEADAKTIESYDINNSNYTFTSNAHQTFSVSGFGYADSLVKSEKGKFGIKATVYYYQGAGYDDVTVEYFYPFSKEVGAWQFVSGSFSCQVGAQYEGDEADYSCVHKIEVSCVYSNQTEYTYAKFDNIAVNSIEHTPMKRYQYDGRGNVVAYNLRHQSRYYFYDDITNDLLIEADNYSGRYTEYTYDSSRRLISEIEYTFIWVRSENGEPTDEILNDEDFLYTPPSKNSEGEEESEETEKIECVRMDAPTYMTLYTYDNYGLCTKIELGEAEWNTLEDGTNEVRHIPGTALMTSVYEYDTASGSKAFGALKKEESCDGIETEYFYDSQSGRKLAYLNCAYGNGVSYEYDALGRLVGVFPAEYNSDETGHEKLSGEENVSYTYDASGRLGAIATDTTEYRFTYDAFGNSDKVMIGENKTLVDYEYNPKNGKLIKMSYGNGFAVRYVYDILDNISEIWYTDNGVESLRYSYEYTTDGQISSIEDHGNGLVTVYRYDSSNRMISFSEYSTEDYYNNITSDIIYDDKSRVSQQLWHLNYIQAGEPEYSLFSYRYYYTQDGKISGVSATLGSSIDQYLTYDKFDRLVGVSTRSDSGFYNEGTYEYLEGGAAVRKYTSVAGTSSNNETAEYTYGYDFEGNLVSITVNGRYIGYLYDNLGQLCREDNSLLGETYEYIYDDAGNILNVNVYEYELFGLEGKEKKASHSYGYTNGEWGDLLTTYDGVEIIYDDIGNPIRYYNGMMMDLYWEGRRLTSADVASYRLEFEYNEDGIRTAKCVNGTTHAYAVSGERIIHERWAGNILLYVYDASGSPIGMKYLSTGAAGEWASFWFEKNLQGDIVAVYSDDGTKLISYTYDAWGNFDIEYFNGGASSPAAFNPFRYRGYYFDKETGFYYLNSRYYDPDTCRFISAEPNVYNGGFDNGAGLLGYNVYAYCANNPVEFSDPTGEFILTSIVVGSIVGAVIGGAIGGTVAYNSAKSSGLEGSDLLLATADGAVKGALIGGVAGGLTGATGAVVASYGAASVAGTAMITSTATIMAKATEATALQAKKSINDGDNKWQVANDCINSVFSNGGKNSFACSHENV